MTLPSYGDCVAEILAAEARIRPLIRETPLEQSSYLSWLTGCNVFLKLEHLQHTGSFKLRGAMSKLTSLPGEKLESGVVAASMGNHGLAVAYAAGARGIAAEIYLPRVVSPSKAEMIRSLGASVIFEGDNCLHAESRARHQAERSGKVFISPYNDPQVIAGQGTLGTELHRQLPGFDAVFIAVGGGGLIAGIGSYLKSVNSGVEVVGCWPENSRVLYESLRAGRILDFPEKPTCSESTAGGVEPGSITFPLCQQVIDRCVLVSETEIREAMRLLLEKEHWLVEGAAGVALAAFLTERERYTGKNIVVVLCGRNISDEVFADLR